MHNNEMITYESGVEEVENFQQIHPQLCNNYSEMRGSWSKNKMRQICPYIKKWNPQQLILGSNENTNIIREIAHIQFCQLKALSLFENNIQSIQGLSRMYLPAFSDWISIRSNHILNVSDLRKCFWPLIQGINICNNHINDASILTQMHLKENFQFLTIEHNSDPLAFRELRWIMKIQSKNLQTLYILSPKRSEQFKNKAIIQRRFPKIQIKLSK